jgi:uncharacterized protein (TIGR02452 family)
MLTILPVQDSFEIAGELKRQLWMERDTAQRLGKVAWSACKGGWYHGPNGETVDWSAAVDSAVAAKVSIAPDAVVPAAGSSEAAGELTYPETTVQISNTSTLRATRALVEDGFRPLALNFANGTHVCGGFLSGARAQEENLCRSSALHATLEGDPMYEYHRRHNLGAEGSAWAILSPGVPVFRTDDGTTLSEPWLADFITCAAPIAARVGATRAAELLRERIDRILEIAGGYGYRELVLGAWGCGAFGNDPTRTARDFRNALEGRYDGVFGHVVFAIADWSRGRRLLGPFRDVFAGGPGHGR